MSIKDRYAANGDAWVSAATSRSLEMPSRFVVAQGLPIPAKRFATPFDGRKATTLLSYYAPIASGGGVVYVTEPLTGPDESRISGQDEPALGLSLGSARLLAEGHDGDPGHRGTTVAVASNGDVLALSHRHNDPWLGKRFIAGDLANEVTLPDPDPTTQTSYRQMYRDPHTGTVWVCYRKYSDYSGRFGKWNTSTNSFDLINGGAAVTDRGGYGFRLAFGVGVIYLAMEWRTTNTGAPRRTGTVAKSIDDGATWTDMQGAPITLPITRFTATTVFPTDDQDIMSGINVAVDGDGLPVLTANYPVGLDVTKPRSMHFARWDSVAGEFVRGLLVEADGSTQMPKSGMTYHNGRIVVVASQYGQSQSEEGPVLTAGPSWLLITDNGGRNWQRRQFTDGTPLAIHGSYIDREALASGVIRILPVFSAAPAKSEVWEMTL